MEHPRVRAVVFGLATSQLIGWSVLYYPFSVLVGPMEAELGWSRPELNGALTIGLLTAGLVGIPVGHWIDRRGPHGLMTAGALLGAFALLLWSMVETKTVFYLLWIALGFAQGLSLGEPAYAAITANVTDYRRALTQLSFLSGLSITMGLPLTQVLYDHFGWRHALLVLAAIQIVGPALVNWLALRGTRGSRSGEKSAADGSAETSPLRVALANPVFWALTLAFCAYSFSGAGLTFHIVAILKERGASPEAIVGTLALQGPAQLAGRFLLFAFGREASARRIGAITMLFVPAAFLLLQFIAPYGLAGLVVFSVVYGLSTGLILIVRATGIAEMLGTRGYGAIAGAMNTLVTFARVAGPLTLAFFWQAFGDYVAAIWLLFALTSLSAVAFWCAAFLSRPKLVEKRVLVS
jgi:MFS family permease